MRAQAGKMPAVHNKNEYAGEIAEDYCEGGDCFAKARGAINPERAGAREWGSGSGAGDEGGCGERPD